MINNKGVSGVIVAVLMILLVIAAVAIYWTAVRPFIEKSTEGVDTTAECLSLDLSVVSAVYTTAANTLALQVKRDLGEVEIDAINVYVGGTKLDATITGADIPGILETKTIPSLAIVPLTTITTGQQVYVAGFIDGQICGTQSDAVAITIA